MQRIEIITGRIEIIMQRIEIITERIEIIMPDYITYPRRPKKDRLFLFSILFAILRTMTRKKNDRNSQLIKQHNALTQAKYSLSATELDIFFALLSQIEEESSPAQAYTLDVAWLEGITGKKLNTTQLRQSTEKLLRRIYTLPEEDGSYFQSALLSSARYVSKERKLILRVDPEMGKYLFNLKSNFTLYYLEYALRLNSKFSKRIYQMLSQFRSTGFFKTTIRRLKEQLELVDEDGGEQYKKVSAFRKYVLDVAQKELQGTDINFTYTLVKQGRAYRMIEFRFSRNEDAAQQKRPLAQGGKAQAADGSKAPTALHPQESPDPNKRTLYQRMQEDHRLSHQQIISLFESFDYKTITKALYDIKNNIRDKGVANKAGYTMKCFESLRK